MSILNDDIKIPMDAFLRVETVKIDDRIRRKYSAMSDDATCELVKNLVHDAEYELCTDEGFWMGVFHKVFIIPDSNRWSIDVRTSICGNIMNPGLLRFTICLNRQGLRKKYGFIKTAEINLSLLNPSIEAKREFIKFTGKNKVIGKMYGLAY